MGEKKFMATSKALRLFDDIPISGSTFSCICLHCLQPLHLKPLLIGQIVLFHEEGPSRYENRSAFEILHPKYEAHRWTGSLQRSMRYIFRYDHIFSAVPKML